jgi:hypothetical protein
MLNRRCLAAASLVLVCSVVLGGSAASAESLSHCQSSSKSETDTSVDFYVNNTCDVAICVSARVTERTNVNGDVISGVLLMQPHESGGHVGSFSSADTSQAWSVGIETRATDECY